jgi:arsenite-transporting ATPase
MSKVYALWVNKMVKSREEAQSLRELLSFTKKKEEDPLMTYLLEFQQRIETAGEMLTDEARTAFFFVTLPESLPIAVIRRFVTWFTEFGIPVGGVIVNQVIEPGDLDKVPELVRNRVAMQQEHLAVIDQEFPGMVRAVLPLYDDEVRGQATLRSASTSLFV